MAEKVETRKLALHYFMTTERHRAVSTPVCYVVDFEQA